MSGLSVKITPAGRERSWVYYYGWLWFVRRIVLDKGRSRRGFVLLVPLIGRLTPSRPFKVRKIPPSFGIPAGLATRGG